VANEKIFVFGASGHAKVVLDVIERQGVYRVGLLLDDNPTLASQEVFGYRVIGGKEVLPRLARAEGVSAGVAAIGSNTARERLASWLSAEGFSLVTAVHPSAQVGRGATLGEGCVVMAGSVINPGAKIGANSIVNTGAKVDHDCCIGRGVHLAPGATLCGTVRIGDNTLIGAGSTILPNLTIGANVTVGAGATVVADIPNGSTVVGTPAQLR
jgi:sugar O-acyltransferase (sialic acid O-acetyltransferase NeuD family)